MAAETAKRTLRWYDFLFINSNWFALTLRFLLSLDPGRQAVSSLSSSSKNSSRSAKSA